MMNARLVAALLLGAALVNVGCDAKEPDTAGQQASSAGEASPSTQSLRTSSDQPVGEARRELTLDLGNGVTLKLVPIPAGKFLMGSPDTEKGRAADETQHEVTISKPYYMGTTPVTVEQFSAFVADSGYKTDAEKDGESEGIEIRDGDLEVKEVDGCSWRHPSFDQKRDHPVVQISWNDAQAFCDWLSTKSGKKVRLPTEAQWEYACRAGTQTAYPWGDDRGDGKAWANCSDQSLRKELSNVSAELFFRWDDGFVFTSPVGSFKPNAFGLYDMIGNVWEWCSDWYGRYPKDAVTDPPGADTGRFRVMRGGCWSRGPAYCRSAFRGRRFPDLRYRGSRGFRVSVIAASVD